MHKSKEKFFMHQNCIKHWFDKKLAGNKEFGVGYLVFKLDKAHEEKGKHTKFQYLWIKPFIIHDKLGHHTYHIQSLDKRIDPLPVNGQDLKCCF